MVGWWAGATENPDQPADRFDPPIVSTRRSFRLADRFGSPTARPTYRFGLSAGSARRPFRLADVYGPPTVSAHRRVRSAYRFGSSEVSVCRNISARSRSGLPEGLGSLAFRFAGRSRLAGVPARWPGDRFGRTTVRIVGYSGSLTVSACWRVRPAAFRSVGRFSSLIVSAPVRSHDGEQHRGGGPRRRASPRWGLPRSIPLFYRVASRRRLAGLSSVDSRTSG